MLVADVAAEVEREPFVPLQVVLNDGRRLEIPFKTAGVMAKYGLIVFKGIKKEGSRVAKSFEQIPYEQIERIEPRGSARQRRKKAS